MATSVLKIEGVEGYAADDEKLNHGKVHTLRVSRTDCGYSYLSTYREGVCVSWIGLKKTQVKELLAHLQGEGE